MTTPADYINGLCSFVSRSREDLSNGTSRLTLTPSAMTLLHHRRAALQEILSDRERRAIVKELEGVPIETYRKLFIILSSLRHLQVASSTAELQLDRRKKFAQIGRLSQSELLKQESLLRSQAPVLALQQSDQLFDDSKIDLAQAVAFTESTAAFTTPRKPPQPAFLDLTLSTPPPPLSAAQSERHFTLTDAIDAAEMQLNHAPAAAASADLVSVTAAATATSLPSTPHVQRHNLSSMELDPNELFTNRRAVASTVTGNVSSTTSAIAESASHDPFDDDAPFTSYDRALYILDFSLFPSLTTLELRSLPTAVPSVCMLHLSRLKFALEKLVVRDCWVRKVRWILNGPEVDPDDEQQQQEERKEDDTTDSKESSSSPPPPPIPPSPWQSLRFISIRSSLDEFGDPTSSAGNSVITTTDPSLSLISSTCEILDLSGNLLSFFPDLSPLENLRMLDIGFNSLESLPTDLHIKLGNIQTLILRNNKIVSLGGALRNCFSLEKLDLSYNCISNPSECLGNLSNLIHLEYLWLYGNPLAFHKEYRLCVLVGLWKNRLRILVKEVEEGLLAAEEASRIQSSGNRIDQGVFAHASQLNLPLPFYLDDLAVTRKECVLVKEMDELAEEDERIVPTNIQEDFHIVSTNHHHQPSDHSDRTNQARYAAQAMLALPAPSTNNSSILTTASSVQGGDDASSATGRPATLSSASSVAGSASPPSMAGTPSSRRTRSSFGIPASSRTQSQTLLLEQWVAKASEKLRGGGSSSGGAIHGGASTATGDFSDHPTAHIHPIHHSGKKHAKGRKQRVAKILGEEDADQSGTEHHKRTGSMPLLLGKSASSSNIASTPSSITVAAAVVSVPTKVDASSSSDPPAGENLLSPESSHLAVLRSNLNLDSFLNELQTIRARGDTNWLALYQEYMTLRRQEAERAEEREEREIEEELANAWQDGDQASVYSHSVTNTHVSKHHTPSKHPRRRRTSIDSSFSISSRRWKEEQKAKSVHSHQLNQQHQRRRSSGPASASMSPSVSGRSTPTSALNDPSHSAGGSESIRATPAPSAEELQQAEERSDAWTELVDILATKWPAHPGHGTFPHVPAAAAVDEETREMDHLLRSQFECVVERCDSTSFKVRPSTRTNGSRLLNFLHQTMEELSIETAAPLFGARAHVLLHTKLDGKIVTLYLASMEASPNAVATAGMDGPSLAAIKTINRWNQKSIDGMRTGNRDPESYPSTQYCLFHFSGVAAYSCENTTDATELYQMLTARSGGGGSSQSTSQSSTSATGGGRDLDREIHAVRERTRLMRRRRSASLGEGGDGSGEENDEQLDDAEMPLMSSMADEEAAEDAAGGDEQRFLFLLLVPTEISSLPEGTMTGEQFSRFVAIPRQVLEEASPDASAHRNPAPAMNPRLAKPPTHLSVPSYALGLGGSGSASGTHSRGSSLPSSPIPNPSAHDSSVSPVASPVPIPVGSFAGSRRPGSRPGSKPGSKAGSRASSPVQSQRVHVSSDATQHGKQTGFAPNGIPNPSTPGGSRPSPATPPSGLSQMLLAREPTDPSSSSVSSATVAYQNRPMLARSSTTLGGGGMGFGLGLSSSLPKSSSFGGHARSGSSGSIGQAPSGPLFISSYIQGDLLVDFYSELLTGKRVHSDLKSFWNISVLQHPLCKFEKRDENSSTPMVQAGPTKPSILPRALFGSGGSNTTVSAPVTPATPSLVLPHRNPLEPFYLDATLLLTASHVVFLSSRETPAQARFRLTQALARQVAQEQTALPPAPTMDGDDALTLRDQPQSTTPTTPKERSATPEVVSTSLPPSRMLPPSLIVSEMHPSASRSAAVPPSSPKHMTVPMEQSRSKQALHKTFQHLLSSSVPKTGGAAVLTSPSKLIPAPPTISARANSPRRWLDFSAYSGGYGSEGESTNDEDTDGEGGGGATGHEAEDEDADTEDNFPGVHGRGGNAVHSIRPPRSNSPRRFGRDRSSRPVPSSRARAVRDQTRTALATQLGQAPSLAPAPLPKDGVPSAAALPSQLRMGGTANSDGSSSHRSTHHASAAIQAAQPALVAMLRQLEVHSQERLGGSSAGGRSRDGVEGVRGSLSHARTGRSPSPLRTSLRRAREMSKRQRGEEVTEEDLYEDIDREYGGFTDDAALLAKSATTSHAGTDADESDRETASLYVRHRIEKAAAPPSVAGPRSTPWEGILASTSASQVVSPQQAAEAELANGFPELPPDGVDPFLYNAESVPLVVLIRESYINLARVVLGLGMQHVRFEFYSGNSMLVLTGSKHLTSSLIVAVQALYLAHIHSPLLIENEDQTCLQKIQMQVFGSDSGMENLRSYEVVKLLDVDLGGGDHTKQLHATHSDGSYEVATAPTGSVGFFHHLTSAAPVSSPVVMHTGTRLPLPGLMTVIIVNDEYIYLVEELYLFQHCTESSMSSRARESKRKQNANLQKLLREWHIIQKEDERARGHANASASPPRPKHNGKEGPPPIQRFRIIAAEPIQQLAQVDRTSMLTAEQSALGAAFIWPFSLCLTLTFGKRTTAFQRQSGTIRQWTFACSETSVQRLQQQLQLQLTR